MASTHPLWLVAWSLGVLGAAPSIAAVNMADLAVDVDEGDAVATITVTADDPAPAGGVVVDVIVAGVDATDGDDFDGTGPFQATILQGETTATVDIPLLQDALDELDESFTVTIDTVTGDVAGAQLETIVTIADDDVPVATFASATATVGEGAGSVDLTVTLSIAPAQTVTLTATPVPGSAVAADFSVTPQTVTFNAGVDSAVVSVAISDDAIAEGDETFTVVLSDPTNASIGAADTATVTITDNEGQPQLVISPATQDVSEGAGTANFTVTLTPTSTQAVSVTATPTPGTASASDIATTPQLVSFAPGEASKVVSVALTNDTLDEDDETFTVVLSAPTNAAIATATATATITDNDNAPSVTLSGGGSVAENAGTVTVTATLSTASGKDVSGTVTPTAGTAGLADFGAAVPFTILAGATSVAVQIAITNDTLDEADTESFTLALTGVVNANVNGLGVTVTINDDDDPPTIALIGPAPVAEGSTATFIARLSTASGRAVTASLTLQNGTADGGVDFNNAAVAVNIPAGSTEVNLNVATTIDDSFEDDETFTGTLGTIAGATAGSVGPIEVTILDDDDEPTLSIADLSVDESAATATLTVTLVPASGKVTRFNARTVDGSAVAPADYDAVNQNSVTIAKGITTATVVVDINEDLSDEDDETFTVVIGDSTLDGAVVGDGSATVTIRDNDLAPVISVDDAADVIEGQSAVFTIRLSVASGREVTTRVQTTPGTAAQADFLAVNNGLVTFPPGSDRQTVNVGTVDDALDENDGETFSLALNTIVGATGGDVSANARINDNDNPPTVSIADASVTEGNGGTTTMAFALSLSAASAKTITLTATPAAGTALTTRDFTAAPQVFTFTPGQTTATYNVTVNADNVHEATTETLSVSLGTFTNVSGGDTTATGTITDDDPRPSISIADATLAVEGSTPTSLNFVVTLSNPSEAEARAAFAASEVVPRSATVNGDFFAQSNIVIIPALATTNSQPVTIPIFGDDLDEGDETFQVVLSTPQNCDLGDAVGIGTIVDDDDAPSFVFSDVVINENGGNATITLLLSDRGGLEASVDFTTVDGNAVAGSDYSARSGRATIPAGQQSTTINVPITNDTLNELDETFTLRLSNPLNGQVVDAEAIITIRDNDQPPTIAVAGVSVVEGNDVTTPANFAVTLSTVSGRTVTARARTVLQTGQAGAADIVAVDEVVTIPAGQTSAVVSVGVVGDRLAETDETFQVQLSEIDGAVGGTAPAVGVIENDDIGPDVVDDSYSTDEEVALTVDVLAGVLRNDSDSDGDPLTVTVETPPLASQGVIALADDGSFTFTPALNFAGLVEVGLAVTDGNNSTGSTLSITVANVNDAPVVDVDEDVSVRVEEDDFDNGGARLADIDAAISDVDLGSSVGIAIIAVDDVAGGAFEFSTDGGVTFAPVGTVSETSALRLTGAAARLRLVPPEGSNDAFNVTYVAWDQTDGGSAGSRVDVSGVRGGSSAFSIATGSIEFNVEPVNDAPVFTPPAQPIIATEGVALNLNIPAFDEDGPELSLRIEASDLPTTAVINLGTPISGAAPGTVTATLTWTPIFSEAGDYTLTIVADDTLLEESLTITIHVDDIDVDGDGVPDTVEAIIGTSTGSSDSDEDTILDIEELGPDPQNPLDSDEDDIIDALDDDSDGDGILDSVEAGDANLGTAAVDVDRDGVPDYLDEDSDDDGVGDGEDNCRVNENTDQADLDDDLQGDACDTDDDGDRVLDQRELQLGLDPRDPDSDDDTILDGEEAPGGEARDSDDDDTIDALDDDSDGDGILDIDEAGDLELFTDPRDSDGDGLDDYIDDDSDNDGVGDDVDNCIFLENPNQEDVDGDGNGDLCVAECGDGVIQFGEDCDDPDDINCTPECTRACTDEICDGIDNDCDGEVDLVKDGNEGLRSVCDEDITLQGGGLLGLLGCSSGGSGADVGLLCLLGLPLWLRRRRRRRPSSAFASAPAPATVAVLILVASSGAAQAQEAQGLGVNAFTPAPIGTTDFVTVEGTAVNGHLLPTAAIVADYGYSQLQVKDRLTGAQVALLEHRLSADVVASISLFNRFAFWVGLPVSLYQAAGVDEVFQPVALAPFALGDVRFGGRWSIVSMRDGPGVALTMAGSGGTGSVENLTSAGAFTFRPQLNAGWRFGDAGRVALNVGYLFRPQQELLTLRVGNELTYGVGGEMPLFLSGLSGLAEVNGRLSADPAITASQSTSPLETLVGARYVVADGHAVTAGAAVGITAGYGTPLLRGFVGYTWSPQGQDRDGDTVPDDVDRCPDIPEDEDFYEDSDGCPDEDAAVDADEDGVIDIAAEAGAAVDQCPDLPEDKDGFEDDDGCPDMDHDGDGLDEASDTCPDEPEDRDGFQDDDGCPDVDNDGDGLHDSVDRCPNAAEIRNGFEDDDGCPDVPPSAAPAVAGVDTPTPTPEPETKTAPTKTPDPTPSTEPPHPPMQGRPGAIIFPQKIYFTVAGAVLTPEGRRLVDQVAEAMKQNPAIRVEVQGHTDGQGDDRVNDHLALRRAESVVGYLVSRGVERPRLLIAILGKSMPLAPNDSPRERALNRRVEFRVLAEADDVR